MHAFGANQGVKLKVGVVHLGSHSADGNNALPFCGQTGQYLWVAAKMRAKATGGRLVFDAKQVDELTRNVLNMLPSGLQEMQRDLEKNLHSALQSVLGKLDLVTREEFEVQAAVLLRTREKLEALEARLAALEGVDQNKS